MVWVWTCLYCAHVWHCSTNFKEILPNFFLGYVEGLKVVLLNTSSVSVSWLPLHLPYGVQQHKFIIHYTGSTVTSSLDIIDSGHITVSGCHAIITGLISQLFYDISVEAIVLDGGEYWSGDFLSSSNATIFVPGQCSP